MIDLRSDTVTQPTPDMLKAMMAAAVGDDVLGDESATTELERRCAQLTGKEACLFVPSGTMGNQICIATHTQPGDAVLMERGAHVLFHECGGPAVISNVITCPVDSVDGVMAISDLHRCVMIRSEHTPGTRLLCIENSNNRAGGTVINAGQMAEFRAFADEYGLKIHLDGARIFNAATALGVPVIELTKHVDSVMFCLSKGLGAPVGSVICGSADFIRAARQWRKRLGGGLRQSGILAAAGLYGLEHIAPKLADDHRRAKEVGSGLVGISGISVYPEKTVTNILLIHTQRPASEWVAALAKSGVQCLAADRNRVRLVFHHQVGDDAVPAIIDGFRQASASLADGGSVVG